MGGGVSLPKVPLSVNLQDTLKEKYVKLSQEGKDDVGLSTYLDEKLPGLIVFDQVDCDHSGKISRKELQRLLKALPRKKPCRPREGGRLGKRQRSCPLKTWSLFWTRTVMARLILMSG